MNTSIRPRKAAPSSVAPTVADDVELQADQLVSELEPLIARQRQAMAQVWQDRSVSKSNLHILMLLEQTDRLPMSRIASLLGVSLPSLTGIVDRMEEHGLVERDRDEADRRVVLIRATPKGLAIVQEMEQARRRYLREIMCALEPAERRTCLKAFRAMRRVAERIDATSGVDAAPCMRPSDHRRSRPGPAGG